MMLWPASYPDVLSAYFGTHLIQLGIAIAVAALILSLIVFRTTRSRDVKTGALVSGVFISASLWIFLLASLALCWVFRSDYAIYPLNAVVTVARLALIPAVALGPITFYLLRKKAVREIYPYFVSPSRVSDKVDSIVENRVMPIFSEAASESKLSPVQLSIVSGESWLPASAALEWGGKKLIAISRPTVAALDDEELKAVFAHELGHIVHRDSLQKTVATAFRTAFPFDPLIRFTEAAIYRNGELNADEYSARLTGKPASLASALLKIYENLQPGKWDIADSVALSPLMRAERKPGLFSKQPPLSLRIRRLLDLDVQMTGGRRAPA